MALFSRIKTESISKELFNQLSENNVNTAWEYAFSHDTRRKNNVEADLESVEYEILYDDSWIENTISSDNEMMIFTIKSLFDFNLTISSVIRTCLKISSSTLDRLVNGEAIFVGGKPLQKKRKVRNGDIVQVNTEQLRRQCQDIR